jgi:MFS family permease
MAEQGEFIEPTGLRVLRERNLWPYLVGTLASACGTWFQNIAQAILVYRLTGSTFLVGVVNFSQFAGTLALAPWAGAAADRYDRRQLMIVTQVASVVVTGVLAIVAAADAASAPVVIGLAGVLGLVSAFSTPAMLSMVPLLVPDHEIRGAIALNAATFNLARAVGPVIGAFVVAHFGFAMAFALNSISYLALIVALLVVHPRSQPERPATRPKLRESFAVIRADTYLTLLLVAVMVVAFTSDPVTTLTPGFATEVFHHRDTWAGALIGAYGLGAVLAALGAGRLRDPERTLTIGLSIAGVGGLAFALAPNLGLGLGGMLAGGYGYLTSSTTTTAALQLGVDENQRGRVMAIWSVAFVGVRPFASLADGAIASGVGLRAAGVTFALPALAMAAVFLFRPGRARVARSRQPAPPRPDGPSRR